MLSNNVFFSKEEMHLKYLNLRARGHTRVDIMSILGISEKDSKTLYCATSKEFKILKDDFMQQLKVQYGMTQPAIIHSIGSTLRQITERLSDIGVASLSTEKLLDYKLKYTSALQMEFENVIELKPDIIGAINDLRELSDSIESEESLEKNNIIIFKQEEKKQLLL